MLTHWEGFAGEYCAMRQTSTVVPFRPRAAGSRPARRGDWLSSARELGPMLFVLPLAAFAGVWLLGASQPVAAVGSMPQPAITDSLQANFTPCSGSVRVTCVVDGDTLWYAGTKIRVADIDAPEVSRPACANEAAMGAAATRRFTALLNAGAFSLEADPDSPDTDRYGRALRLVTRGGASLGDVLVEEGLAEQWGGPRIAWC